MTDQASNELQSTLSAAADGDEISASRVFPLVYDELRAMAAARLAKLPPGQTLQATALVHEVYVRIAGRDDAAWQGKGHFFFAAARAMRDIVVEDARRKGSQKRGGGRQRVALAESQLVSESPLEDVLATHCALEKLEEEYPELSQIVMLRFFAGLGAEESSELLGLSPATLKRRWRFIWAWLRREMALTGDIEPPP